MDTESSDFPLFADLDENDPAAVEAAMEARITFRQFLDAISKGLFSQANYLVKVPFINGSELGEHALVRKQGTAAKNPTRPIRHLWLIVTSVLDDLIFCSVGEAPDAVHLKRDTSFVVSGEVIEDWMINHGGIAFGGFSLRVIRNRLHKEEQMEFDAHTGIREFEELMP
jgi:uncharacterized protein YegJ (DUF2314 family)